MPMTPFAGFDHPVQDAQFTFRALLNALAYPGQPFVILPSELGDRVESTHRFTLETPPGMTPALAAACLTLLDLETVVWLQPGFNAAIPAWLRFHTGCQSIDNPQQANFALIKDSELLPPLSTFQIGTAAIPEASTTLLVQLESFTNGSPVTLEGPGILSAQTVALPGLPHSFWSEWTANVQSYPQGVDMLFFTHGTVLGLPRTAKARVELAAG
jgi:alpha-D-ribose 1-methylphosphonate 5-triphosphate synthase subunit PhnH